MAEYWMNVGAVAHHNGPERETLFKNLHTEFQRMKIKLHVSGAETVGKQILRNSEELFKAYEQFYQLFYPHGGSAVPSFVMTENSVQYVQS